MRVVFEPKPGTWPTHRACLVNGIDNVMFKPFVETEISPAHHEVMFKIVANGDFRIVDDDQPKSTRPSKSSKSAPKQAQA